MWPSRDFNRIRTKISAARQRGILHGINRETGKPKHKRRAHIYDATGSSDAVSWSAFNPDGGAPDTTEQESVVVQPKSILLRRPPPSEVEDFHASDAPMELVVDAAGKVRSAKLLTGADPRWIQASAGWHFIPAFLERTPRRVPLPPIGLGFEITLSPHATPHSLLHGFVERF